MAALKEQVKLFIIQRLACFDTPTEVVEAVKEELDIDLNRAHIAFYDPTTVNGKELSDKFKKVFFDVRKNFLDDFNSIPEANISVRVRELSKMRKRANKRGNDVLAASLLEQIAKETGGFYTNKFKVGTDVNDLLAEMLKTFVGGSMPIVHDVDFVDINSESEEFKQVESKPKKTWSKK